MKANPVRNNIIERVLQPLPFACHFRLARTHLSQAFRR